MVRLRNLSRHHQKSVQGESTVMWSLDGQSHQAAEMSLPLKPAEPRRLIAMDDFSVNAGFKFSIPMTASSGYQGRPLGQASFVGVVLARLFPEKPKNPGF